MKLTQQQMEAVALAKKGRNLFLTGPAGTGKSVVLREVVTALEAMGKRVAVTASTGLAAVNVGGRTAHAWLGTAICGNIRELREFARSENGPRMLRNAKRRIKETDVLVIDEISMLTGDFLDMADHRLKQVRESFKQPLGGLQAIFVGDFMQLPPVVKEEREQPKAHYAFQSRVWRALEPKPINLTKVFRQNDKAFYKALEGMRMGYFEESYVRLFDDRVAESEEQIIQVNPTRLYPTRRQVERINHEMLFEREPFKSRKLFRYLATLSPDRISRTEWIKRFGESFIAVPELELKQGVPVLINANVSSEEGIVNGTRGTVTSLDASHVTVEVDANGSRRQITFNTHSDRWTWEHKGSGNKPLAFIKQLPIMPAYALTVHKGQGMSLDPVHAALSANFAEGQVYVALSRARRLEGLTLDRLLRPGDIKVNEACRQFHAKLVA